MKRSVSYVGIGLDLINPLKAIVISVNYFYQEAICTSVFRFELDEIKRSYNFADVPENEFCLSSINCNIRDGNMKNVFSDSRRYSVFIQRTRSFSCML